MGFVGDVVGDLFGSEPEVTQQSGFGAAPGFAQQGIREITERGLQASRDPNLFAPAPLNEIQQSALNRLAAGGPQIRDDFRPQFMRRASTQFGRAGETFSQANPFIQRSQNFLTEALSNIGRGTQDITGAEFGSALQSFTNPFTQQVLDPALQDIREQTQGLFSDIGAQATGAGAFGGQRQALLESEAARAGAREAGRLSGQLRRQGFEDASRRALSTLESNRERALRGAGLNINQAGQSLAGASALTNLGQAQAGLGGQLVGARGSLQNIRQNIADRELGDIQRQLQAGTIMQQQQQGQRTAPLEAIRFGQETVRPFFGSGVQQTPGGGFFDSPGGSALLSAGSTFLLSDERYKKNIKKIGEKNGYNIYEFSYLDSDNTHRGVMAQEVELKNPEAVREFNGIKHVNYEAIGIEPALVS